jgi:membrane associated rhomboid family serine protease
LSEEVSPPAGGEAQAGGDAEGAGGRAGAAPWLAVCAVLGGGSLLAWWMPAALLDWQPARATAEPWRLVTAAWVHWSELHLAANLAGTAVVAALGWAARLPAGAALALALAWPLTQAGLWVQPALAHYGGASGVLHAAVAIAAGWLMAGVGASRTTPARAAPRAHQASETHQTRRARLIGAAIATGLVLKVLSEEPWSGPIAAARTWDIAVAPIAHASGTLAGAAVVLVVLLLRPRRQARR